MFQPHVLLALGSYDYRTHRGVARYAGKHHWHLNSEMCFSGRLPHGWRGDGILTALNFQPDLIRFIKKATVPVVDIALNRPDIQVPRVLGDNESIGTLAAEHFMGRGFRYFAWHANDTLPPSEQRWNGFSHALAHQGLQAERWIWNAGARSPGDLWSAKCQWLIRKLEAIPKPAAVFAFRDTDAANVLDACLAVGLAVPYEIAILGVDNNDLICETLSVPLSSVCHDLEALGYEAAALLDRLMRGEAPPEQPILIPPCGLVVRPSTDVLAVNHEPCRCALRFLQLNMARNIGVADAVRASGLSRRALEKAFREHIGRTVGQELTRLRLAKVKELLLSTDLTVVDIAAQTGFATPQYLNHVFVKATGLQPRKFRLRRRSPAA